MLQGVQNIIKILLLISTSHLFHLKELLVFFMTSSTSNLKSVEFVVVFQNSIGNRSKQSKKELNETPGRI